MESTVRMAPPQAGCPAPTHQVRAALDQSVAVAPIAAHNAPHLPRYLRSRQLIEQAQRAAQQAIALRAQQWQEAAPQLLAA